jgi:hypothetical protein
MSEANFALLTIAHCCTWHEEEMQTTLYLEGKWKGYPLLYCCRIFAPKLHPNYPTV